jgi:hypothetical protein
MLVLDPGDVGFGTKAERFPFIVFREVQNPFNGRTHSKAKSTLATWESKE